MINRNHHAPDDQIRGGNGRQIAQVLARDGRDAEPVSFPFVDAGIVAFLGNLARDIGTSSTRNGIEKNRIFMKISSPCGRSPGCGSMMPPY